MTTAPTSFLRRPAARWVALGISLVLLASALVVAFGQRDALSRAMEVLQSPAPELVALLLLTIVAHFVVTGFGLQLLMRRFGRVGTIEMQALIASGALFNYLPMRAGLLGRVAYHNAVNGIAARDSARVVIESLGLTAGMGTYLAVALLVGERFDVHWTALAAAPIVGLSLLAIKPGRTRLWCVVGMLREVELLLNASRYILAFRLLELDLSMPAAVALACCSAVASLTPLPGAGLGLREWMIGLLAPVLTEHAVETGITADLVNRAMELLVTVALGSAGVLWLSRHKAPPTPRDRAS